MEHGNSFFHYGEPEKSSSDSNPLQKQPVVQQEQEQAEGAREENQFMPIACVQRLMRKVLPKHAKVTEASKARILECVTEFISFITVEANHHCQVEQRKTVTAEDLINAMRKLGFDKYAELLTLYLHRYRQQREVPHRVGSLPTLPSIANINDAVHVSPIVSSPLPFPNSGFYNDWSSVGGSSSANDVYYDPVAYFNSDNFFSN